MLVTTNVWTSHLRKTEQHTQSYCRSNKASDNKVTGDLEENTTTSDLELDEVNAGLGLDLVRLRRGWAGGSGRRWRAAAGEGLGLAPSGGAAWEARKEALEGRASA